MEVKVLTKIKYINPLTRFFCWILKGPIEDREFTVKLTLNSSLSENQLKNCIRIEDINTNDFWGDPIFIMPKKISDNKFQRSKKVIPRPRGRYEMRVYFSDLPENAIIVDGYGNEVLTVLSKGYNTISSGTRYYKEPFTIHPIQEVLLIIFALIATIGAFFEILGYFKS